jgi:hypothetical protein
VGSAFAILPGSPSNFESNDGNMIVTTAGNNDWASVSFTKVSDPAQSTSDDSFTPGQKQDTTCPSVSGHKNSPKDDFTQVATYTETASNGDVFLYGATIRYAANGTASENVELNQGTNGLCPSSTFPVRVDGDQLITIDYTNGGANVAFGLANWTTTGACFVGSDTAPCWQTPVPLTANVEGLASPAAITAANNPISNAALVAGQFAEFGINLSKTGIIPTTTCKTFNTTDFESRASGTSFVSSTKDVSIVNKPISNCGKVIIRKVTVPSPDATDTTFNYTTNVVTLPATTTSPFSLKNGQNNEIDNVKKGSYSVTESDPGPNFKLTALSCAASDLSHGSTIDSTSTTTGVASFTLQPEDTIDCTYTNTLQTGALKIVKESTKTGNPLVANPGAEFCYSTSTGCTVTNVTDNGTGDGDSTTGSVCVSGLALGDYYVNETKAPSGYGGASQTDQKVTVVSGTNCTNNKPTGTAVATFTNPPLSDIQVRFRDGGSGETTGVISCDNTDGTTDTGNTTGWDNTTTVTGVTPQKVTCTITIDP